MSKNPQSNIEPSSDLSDKQLDKPSQRPFLSYGFLYGALSALFYTISALCVRQLVELDSPYALPLCIRESIAAFVALPIVIVGLIRGTIPSNQWRFWGLLFGVSCLMQVLGNVTYMWMFDMAGIAIALACVWSGGLFCAQMSDLFLMKEKFSYQTVIALTIILAAVCCIGIGLGLSENTLGSLNGKGVGLITLLILGGLLVGIVNSLTQASVRISHKNNVPFWVPMLLVPGSGTVVLGALSIYEHGSGIFTALTGEQLFFAILAGIANLAAFIALVKGLSSASLAYMFLMNASQVALGALAGIFWFMEPSNGFIVAGLVLTVIAVLTAR